MDTAALEDLLLRLGRLAEDLPEVAELDLNPVLAGPAGVLAVDVKLRLARRWASRTRTCAACPNPPAGESMAGDVSCGAVGDSVTASVAACLRAALAAPSIHKSQPWRFQVLTAG